MTRAYERFMNRVREVGQLSAIESLLDWDQETLMPPKGIEGRSAQLSLMARFIHERQSAPEIGDLLAELDGHSSDPVVETNVREFRRAYHRAVKVPADLVAAIARTSSRAKAVWAMARADDHFAVFAPHLAELIKLKRELADHVGYAEHRYDALLDEFEPDAKTADIAKLFAELGKSLAEFVQRIVNSPAQPDESILHRPYPRAAQESFARHILAAIGFDFDAGRLDVSAHPFCSGTTPTDVRLTTRYDETFFSPAFFGSLHEAGHGLYEQGLDPQHVFTPAGHAASLGIHESQSLFWENFVGRSQPFWQHFYPDCQKSFAPSLDDVNLDAFVGAVNVVKPSFIRVEADEVTYNLHIILRFNLELDLLDGRLDVADLPEAWNAGFRSLLGLDPPSNRLGCLQDIHWSMGSFGYFPTYALGKLYAAQFFEAIRRDVPDLDERVSRGELATLLEWLRVNIHRLGMRYPANELVRRVTGQSLSVKPFLNYLENKFTPLYAL